MPSKTTNVKAPNGATDVVPTPGSAPHPETTGASDCAAGCEKRPRKRSRAEIDIADTKQHLRKRSREEVEQRGKGVPLTSDVKDAKAQFEGLATLFATSDVVPKSFSSLKKHAKWLQRWLTARYALKEAVNALSSYTHALQAVVDQTNEPRPDLENVGNQSAFSLTNLVLGSVDDEPDANEPDGVSVLVEKLFRARNRLLAHDAAVVGKGLLPAPWTYEELVPMLEEIASQDAKL